MLRGDLEPATRSCAEIDQDAGFRQEVVLAIELDQLECGTGAVTLILGEAIVRVETCLGLLLGLGTHLLVFLFFRFPSLIYLIFFSNKRGAMKVT